MWTPVVVAVATVAGIALAAGLLLGFANRQLPANNDSLVDKINLLLPQTQCAQCGYVGCKPYAQAIVEKDEALNLCPPGGQETVDKLGELLGRDAVQLANTTAAPSRSIVALIDEELCIGCMHCREACPVDAIVGTQQLMHSIIASECTGCELCVPPCPVDCISMVPAA